METDLDFGNVQVMLENNYIIKTIFCEHRTETLYCDIIMSYVNAIKSCGNKFVTYFRDYVHIPNVDVSKAYCVTFVNSNYLKDHEVFQINLLSSNKNNVLFKIVGLVCDSDGFTNRVPIDITDLNNTIKNESIIEFTEKSFPYFEKIRESVTSFKLKELLPQKYICLQHALTKRAVAK